MFERMKAYEALLGRVQTAWSTFKDGIATSGPFREPTHQALERALGEARDALDAM